MSRPPSRTGRVAAALLLVVASLLAWGLLRGGEPPTDPADLLPTGQSPADGALRPVLVGVEGPPPRAEPEDPTTGSVRGRVRFLGAPQGSGRKAKVRLAVVQAGAVVLDHEVDVGSFHLTYAFDPRAPARTLRIEARGWALAEVGLPGRSEDVGDVLLRPGLGYGGRVTDASGAPIAGVRMELWSKHHGGASRTATGLPSDEAGRFSIHWSGVAFPQLDLAAYVLQPLGDGVCYPAQPAHLDGLRHEHVVVLDAPESIRLRVTRSRDGAPVAAAYMTWTRCWPITHPFAVASERPSAHVTDEDGLFAPSWPPWVPVAHIVGLIDGRMLNYFLPREAAAATNVYGLEVPKAPHEVRVEAVDVAQAPLGGADVNLALRHDDKDPEKRYAFAVRGTTGPDGSVTWAFGMGGYPTRGINGGVMAVVAPRGSGAWIHEERELTPAEIAQWNAGGVLTLACGESPIDTLWVATSRRGARPVSVAIQVPLRRDYTALCERAAYGVEPYRTPDGLAAWPFPDFPHLPSLLESTPGVEALPSQFVTIVRFSDGSTGSWRVDAVAWEAAFDSRTPLRPCDPPDAGDAPVSRTLHVRTPYGAPAPGVMVATFVDLGQSPGRHVQHSLALTDEGGVCTLGPLDPGQTYHVVALDSASQEAAALTFQTRERPDDGIELRLQKPAPFSATIRLPDGKVPKTVSGGLHPHGTGIVSAMRGTYDPVTGELSAGSCVLEMYDVLVVGYGIPTGEEAPGSVPPTYSATLPAVQANGRVVVLR